MIKLFGIETKIHWSWWAFVAFVVSKDLITFNFEELVTKLTVILFLMIAVIMHEFAHALTARKFGANTKSIVLYIFGGIAFIQGSRPFSNREMLLVAVAGPLSNLVVFFPLMFLAAITSLDFFLWAAVLNLAIGVFNLVPAYPMDGGRIFRSLLEMHYVKRENAVKITQVVAITFAILFFTTGLYFGHAGLSIIGPIIAGAIWLERKGVRV